MAPSPDYSPLLAAEHSDQAAGPNAHVFPPADRSTHYSQRRLPRQRPPLWIPDPFSFRSGSTSSTVDRDGASHDSDSDSDSGEDTVYGSEAEEDSSGEKRQAGSGPFKNESTSTSDEEDGWEFSLAALQKDRTRVSAQRT